MAIQSQFYTPDGSSKKFLSSKHIASKTHVAVFFQETDLSWTNVNTGDYDLINNAVVFSVAPVVGEANGLEIRVADSPSELTDSPSDISTLATISGEIAIVAGIESEVVIASNNATNINAVGSNIVDVSSVANNMPEVVNVSTNISDVATVGSNIGSVNDVSADIANVNTVATNIADVNDAYENALTAKEYATNPEDDTVYDHVNAVETTDYSAKHHANKAAASALSIDPATVLHTEGYGGSDPEGVRIESKRSTTITPNADSDYTLGTVASDENLYGRLTLVDGSWTATHNIIVDTSIRDFMVDNSAGTYDATVKTSAGTGLIVQAGQVVKLYCDGTDVVSGKETGVLSTNDILIVKHEELAGVDGGGSVAATFVTRTLNVEHANTIDGAGLALSPATANQILLPAGKYHLSKAYGICFDSNGHILGLYNVTNSSYIAYGSSMHCHVNYDPITQSTIDNIVFELTVETVIELRHSTAATLAARGLGLDTATSTGSPKNTYASISIEKVG